VNQARANSETWPPLKKSRTKKLRWLVAAAAAVIVSAVFLMPVFVSSETGNKFILAVLKGYLPGRVDFGSLSMGWLKGVVVTDFGFRDIDGQMSVRIKKITTKPHYGSIALGVLSFGQTVIDEPIVEINLKGSRLEAEQRPRFRMAAVKNLSQIALPVKKIELIINNGCLKISPLQAGQAETIELSAINARIKIVSDMVVRKVAVSSLRFDGSTPRPIDTEQSRGVETPHIKIDNGQFRLVSMGGKTDLEGRFDYAYDWAAVSDLVREFLPKGLELKGKRKGTVSFFTEFPNDEMDKLWANLYTSVEVGFDQADYMGLIFEPTEIDIEVEKGLLTIEPFSSKVNNGRLNFAGQVDFRCEPVLLKTTGTIQAAEDIQITGEMTERLLMYLNPVFARVINVGGIVNLRCERLAVPIKGGSRNDIEIAGVISVEHLQLEASELFGRILAAANIAQARDITVRPTRFVLQNGLLRYDDMQMDVGDSPINFKGVIGLDKSLNMTVTLPYTTRGETAKLGRETAGRRITLVLRGTLDKPQIDVGRVLQEQLKQELEGQLKGKLREGLDKLLK
jgi:hypothetical protein